MLGAFLFVDGVVSQIETVLVVAAAQQKSAFPQRMFAEMPSACSSHGMQSALDNSDENSFPRSFFISCDCFAPGTGAKPLRGPVF